MRCLREVSVEMVLKAVRGVTSERRTGMSSEFARALNHATR
jgi:hypothetical protein